MERKPSFSPSRLATYLACPVQYRFDYIDRIGRFYHRSRPGYTVGTALHQALREFHDAGAVDTPDELQARLLAAWSGAGFADAAAEAAELARASAMLEAYREAFHRDSTGAETLWTERGVKSDMGDFVLTGRIDRLDRHPDGALEVVDYKSGRADVQPADVAASLAMRIYQLILRREHPGVPVRAAIIALSSGRRAVHGMTDAEAAAFADEIDALVHEILARDHEAVKPALVPACARCDFQTRCWGKRGAPAASD